MIYSLFVWEGTLWFLAMLYFAGVLFLARDVKQGQNGWVTLEVCVGCLIIALCVVVYRQG